MYNIIIFGTGVTAAQVIHLLNKSCKIIAYLDNNSEIWGKYKDVYVKSPKSISDFKYDFVIIASQFNEEIYKQLISLNVEKNKILQYYKMIEQDYNIVKQTMKEFILSKDNYEMIATGISYCNLGLKVEIIKKLCFKFAFGSQDLYYDYNIVKYILNNYNNKCKNLKYCLIGLSYYSFEYDMSQSSMKNKVMLYYETIGVFHNNPEVMQKSNDYLISKTIADKIFKMTEDGYYEYSWDESYREKVPNYKTKEEIGKLQAKIDCNKNYPKTVTENKKIFKDYLRMLKNSNIKPIVVIFPASKYYTKYFSENLEIEFDNIIEEVRKEYEFQYIDYFRSELFTDNDFVDVSHLNFNGAEKFTRILNEVIEW